MNSLKIQKHVVHDDTTHHNCPNKVNSQKPLKFKLKHAYTFEWGEWVEESSPTLGW